MKVITNDLLYVKSANFSFCKVVVIFGLAGGGCRILDLSKLAIQDVEDFGEVINVNVFNTETNVLRQLTINDDFFPISPLMIIRKYKALRPGCSHTRFFVSYKSGKCMKGAVSINTFNGIPEKIASFLGLPNCKQYTWQSVRHSATVCLP